MNDNVLEPAAQELADATSKPPFLYELDTDGAQDTGSYREVAAGPYLTASAMAWFWDAYTTGPTHRDEITAAPGGRAWSPALPG